VEWLSVGGAWLGQTHSRTVSRLAYDIRPFCRLVVPAGSSPNDLAVALRMGWRLLRFRSSDRRQAATCRMLSGFTQGSPRRLARAVSTTKGECPWAACLRISGYPAQGLTVNATSSDPPVTPVGEPGLGPPPPVPRTDGGSSGPSVPSATVTRTDCLPPGGSSPQRCAGPCVD
jgi:hypothetical protein